MVKRVWLLVCFLLVGITGATAAVAGPVIATVGVGLNPNGIAITPNGKFAYVANNNNNAVPGADTISVIDIATNSLVATIPDVFSSEPYTVTINAAGTKAYVTTKASMYTALTGAVVGTGIVLAGAGMFAGTALTVATGGCTGRVLVGAGTAATATVPVAFAAGSSGALAIATTFLATAQSTGTFILVGVAGSAIVISEEIEAAAMVAYTAALALPGF